MSNIRSIDRLTKNVSRETLDQLHCYAELISKWNKAINLVANSTIPDIWNRHIIDSLQLSPLLPKAPAVMTDMGCGGGLPGLVLATTHPQHQFHMIESDQRKCAFMTQVVADLQLKNVTIHCKRIENTPPFTSDIITSRALASLKQLILYAKPFMTKNSRLLFLKGQNAKEEIEQAQKEFHFTYTVHPSLTTPSGCMIEISEIQKR